MHVGDMGSRCKWQPCSDGNDSSGHDQRHDERSWPGDGGSTVTLDNSGNTWVFFGTGRFFNRSDKTDLRAQYVVGVKDSVLRSGGCVQTT